MMQAHCQYLAYVLRHKWFVFHECRRLRVPLLIALFHDWDKLLPDEWIPYVRRFHGKGKQGRKGTGVGFIHLAGTNEEFDDAVRVHCRRNKHHWQYWVFADSDEHSVRITVRPMPDVYRREMLADWRGAGRAQGTPDTLAWYRANARRLSLHDETRQWIESELGY
jgi:hypothetical protein